MERRGFLQGLGLFGGLWLPEGTRIARHEVKASDVIVIEVPGCISQDKAARLKALFEGKFPGREVIVLGDGITFKVKGR